MYPHVYYSEQCYTHQTSCTVSRLYDYVGRSVIILFSKVHQIGQVMHRCKGLFNGQPYMIYLSGMKTDRLMGICVKAVD